MIHEKILEGKHIFLPEIMIEMIQLIAGFKAFHFRDFKNDRRCPRDEFSLIDRRNLTFNHSVDAEMCLEAIRSERFKDGWA